MKEIKLIFSFIAIATLTIILAACSASVTDFSFYGDYLTLEVGESKKSTDVNNESNLITFFSIDETVATINNQGIIKGENRGETEVYAIYKNSYYKCHIRVTASTKDPDVYEKEVNAQTIFSVPSLNLDFSFKANGRARYNGKNSLIEFNENSKFQYELDLLNAPETKGDKPVSSSLQAKYNVLFFNLVLTFMTIDSKFEDLNSFQKVISDYSAQIVDLEGEELDNKLKEIGDITFYFYLSNNYLAFAIMSKKELKAYAYSNSENGIISKLPGIIRTIKQLITAGVDVQKIDFIDTFKDLTGDLLSTSTRDELKKFQKALSILAYIILGDLQINKTSLEGKIPTERLTFTVLDGGIERINEEFKKQDAENPLHISSISLVMDVTKNVNTNYNYIKMVSLNVSDNDLNIVGKLNLDITDAILIDDKNPYEYESMHSEFENFITKESA